MRHVQPCADAALKIFLAELRHASLDYDGHVVCTRLRQRLRRIWIQGYILCRDGDDVVDVDDGSAVMSLDIVDLLQADPAASSVMQAGRYVSCVCALEAHPEGMLDILVESACGLDGAGDALAEPSWWLEVAEAHLLRGATLTAAPSSMPSPARAQVPADTYHEVNEAQVSFEEFELPESPLLASDLVDL